jgi:hypothetical protein
MKNINDIEVNNPEFVIKQETLEEVAQKYSDDWEEITRLDYDEQIPSFVNKLDFINGAKWQQEQDKNKYSEEDLKEAFESGKIIAKECYTQNRRNVPFNEWFEQFKKI